MDKVGLLMLSAVNLAVGLSELFGLTGEIVISILGEDWARQFLVTSMMGET